MAYCRYCGAEIGLTERNIFDTEVDYCEKCGHVILVSDFGERQDEVEMAQSRLMKKAFKNIEYGVPMKKILNKLTSKHEYKGKMYSPDTYYGPGRKVRGYDPRAL